MKKNLKLSSFYLALVLLVLANGCSPIKVSSSDFSPTAEAADYKTFNFLDVNVEAPEETPAGKERIDMLKNAIEREMEARGLEKSNDPDVWVNIGVVVEDKVQTRQTDIRDAPRYMGQRNYSWQSEEIVVDKYQEGTVTLDFVDTNSNKMVGQSVGSGVLVKNDKKARERIDQGVAQMFNNLWANGK